MTFQEKLDSLKQERTNAISSIRGINNTEFDLEEERDFNNQYLFGDGVHLGVVNFLELYYDELNHIVGRTATTPALHNGLDSTKSSWTSRFESAATLGGDGSLYPASNSDGIANEDINKSSAWLYRNGDQGQTDSGIKSKIDDLNSSLGSEASNNSDGRQSSYTYVDSSAALSAAQSRAQSDRGTALLGRRTQNADENSDYAIDPESPSGNDEIFIEEENITSPPEPQWRYTVGYNGLDHPDYFDEPERSNLLTDLDTLISDLQTYETKITDLETQITYLDDGTNDLFSETGMRDDIDSSSELTRLSSLKSQIQSLLSDLQDQYDYFSNFTASTDISGQSGYSKTDFDNRLTTTIPGLLSSLDTLIDDRVSEVESFIALSDTTLTQSFRKWLYFWVKENIQKPVSPYISLNGISSARNNQIESLDNKTDTLVNLLGNPNQYLSNTPVISAFPNPKTDENGIILQQRVNLLWLGYPAANKYKIFRSKRSDLSTISNDNWTDEYLLTWVVSINDSNGNIDIEYLDTSFDSDTLYIYRVQAFDSNGDGPSSPLSRIDSFDSSSLQSNIYDEGNGVYVSEIDAGRISVPPDHTFIAGSWIYIVADDSSVQDFYLVSAISEESIVLENTSLNLGSSTIYKSFGLIQTPSNT